MTDSAPLHLVATCAPGLEPVLQKELSTRGFQVVRAEPGGVTFQGDRKAMMRANLELGTALQVLWRVARFQAHDFRELDKRLARLPLDDWLPAHGPLRLRAFSRKSRLYHTGALIERLQNALAKRGGTSPELDDGAEQDAGVDASRDRSPDAEPPPLGLVLRLNRDVATLALDTSGEPLCRRGYRLQSGPAPLRADVACALLLCAGYDGARPLFDPMTGTGTLAIEALRIAQGRLPEVRRRFAFEHLPGHHPSALTALQETTPKASPAAPVVARDRDPKAVERARHNARHAGVEACIDWEVGPLNAPSAADALTAPLLVANPPYGRRLGHAKALRSLYAALGERAVGLNAQMALVTSESRLAAATRLPLESALLTDLGGLKVRFYLADAASGG